MPGSRLILGLDYGTTYTGVSLCETSGSSDSGQHIEVIHDWPACHTRIGTKEKVPSEVAYLPEGLRWGSQIPPHQPRQMWTKLELDQRPNGEAAKIVQELTSAASGLRKQPVDIVADFLAQVKTHLMENLDERFGKYLWRTLPITLVITMPAVWSDAAKARTREAIDKAGFNSLSFPQIRNIMVTTEPEAAAIYTIQTMRGTVQDQGLIAKDGFVVCDMGGGTVDLISYEVVKLHPIRVREATVGNGAQCGGTFVDRAFLQWLERRLGTSNFATITNDCRSEDLPRTSLAPKVAKLLQDFTMDAKSGFSGTETNYLQLPKPLCNLADSTSKGIFDGELKITPEDMVTMFEFPLRRTYELILEQLSQARHKGKANFKFVFMVGGFSESPYVYRKIKAFVELNGLQVIKPAYAWSAVVRGAAAIGLEGKGSAAVTQRKSRRHYGTEFSTTFEKGIHRERDAYYCEYTGKKEANNQAEWLITKGQDMPAKHATHASTSIHTLSWSKNDPSMTMRLLACDSDQAPLGTTGQSVYQVAKLTIDLSDVPRKYMSCHISPDGRRYYSIDTLVHISMQSVLEFYVTVNGKKDGSLTAQYH